MTDPVAPKSAHLADQTLSPFIQPTFDPAAYLNSTLPSLALSSVSSRPLKQGNSVPLADLSTQTQNLISQLNAHTTRLSAILTQLTDDILRSGGRLAYEVEVLRGETIGLTETLQEGLKADVEKFVPGGIQPPSQPQKQSEEDEDEEPTSPPQNQATASQPANPPETDQTLSTQPAELSHLHTLTTTRSRLESVIKVFGEAMHWTLPPSTLTPTSFISVSAPSSTSPSNNTSEDPEARGQAFAANLRSEIADLITGSEDPDTGMEAANARIQALRDLATVWRGTAEEKARVKFVEGLAKVAEEKGRERRNVWAQRQGEKEKERERQRARSGSAAGKSGAAEKKAPAAETRTQQKSGGGGFLENLQRIRGDYLS